jgi:hypothetical protein
MSFPQPLRSLIRRQAVSRGFPDPLDLLEKLGRFSEPSEVQYPVELLRAGATMHIRGLFNSAILQYNIDWSWPYWVNRQFDPDGQSFIPRAFSLTHINLTHRNWVAVGLPEIPSYPLIDPTGLVTPYWDGWSLEVWVCDEAGLWHTAEGAVDVEQRLDFAGGLAVITTLAFAGFTVTLHANALLQEDEGACCQLACSVDRKGCQALAIAVRPANPEGVSFVYSIEKCRGSCGLDVDGVPLHFSMEPDAWLFSDYRQGDVFHQLYNPVHEANGRSCQHGMATAAVVFRFDPGEPRAVTCTLPLSKPDQGRIHAQAPVTDWQDALGGACRFHIPDRKFQYITDAALHTLVLLSPGDVYPGSFTYKRFWFRDATYMVSALLAAGLIHRAKRVLDNFIRRQLDSGYFRSQEGEWDSNGQVLWIFGQYFAVSGECPGKSLLQRLINGGEWIRNKRRQNGSGHVHPGLLPAGFSAEHLGPNDYYYWDDFWSVAGLRSLAQLCGACGDTRNQRTFAAEAQDLLEVVAQSLTRAEERNGRPAMPAAPLRRLDSAVIGSLVASYPLRLFEPDDPRLRDSIAYLKERCLVQGVFYQEMIHSGLNAYLTLHLAQAALRGDDPDCFDFVSRIAALASPTGQWPEAIHPATHGGCMGDGQHGWAAAEWLLMMRNLFVREEGETLVLGSGIPPEWLNAGEPVVCKETLVSGGIVSLELRPFADAVEVQWSACWHGQPRTLHVRLSGFPQHTATASSGTLRLARSDACAS